MQIDRSKYPRTFHLSFSESLQSDDKKIESLKRFIGKEVVATLKYDGENTSMYPDGYLHARSIDGTSNWTRDIAKRILAGIQHDIPEGMRLCCENVYAKHSIYYPDGYLDGYVYLLSMWDGDKCLSWDDTLEYAELFDLPTPKEFYRGIFDEKKLQEIAKNLDKSIEEGFVVRLTDSFTHSEFSECVTKFVRKGHVQENAEHWLKSTYPNGIPKSPSKPAFLSYGQSQSKGMKR